MPQSTENLIWIDLEMTGLDTDHDCIIEIATVVTDKNLIVLVEGPTLAIHQSEAVLAAMDKWNTDQHGGSGLVDRVRQSRIDEVEAEQRTLQFLQQWVPPNASPMCGNSICQDRRFLHRCMPKLEQYFHHRNLDVSTIKELVQRWVPEILQTFSKRSTHLAMDDVRESIAELRFYRRHFLRVPDSA
ncbi:MAG: oligoribonuclease [Nitrococcus sp.]|nr:oligoribonuclease [Nitrococcus sp.]